ADVATIASAGGAVLADRVGSPPSLANPKVLIGPEGGWTDAERALAPPVALGDLVLRAETAAITAGAIFAALRSGRVRPLDHN
ncbi:MAG TPA: 16S rRNA (uracil(1498)-N(3))-methyltransferase, partial [Acidimicrobiales bacterium]